MKGNIRSWPSSSLVRHFPATPAQPARSLRLETARNESFSFQLGVRLETPADKPLPAPIPITITAKAPAFWFVRVRRVGYVPVRHRNWLASAMESDGFERLPGYAPDPLFDEATVDLPPLETHAFWMSVRATGSVPPGRHTISVFCHAENELIRKHDIQVAVRDVRLAKRRDFRVTNWFYCDALLDFYECDGFDKKFWEILPAYLRNLSAHGQDTIYTPLLTQATDGVKRPTQLLGITKSGASRYRFDWSDVRRFIHAARRAGITHFEWPHLFTQWGAANAVRIYHRQGREEKLLWPARTRATSPVYRRFLEQLLPELHSFLKEERLLTKSFFHISDEPHEEHLERYRRARELVREIAPWIKAMDALSNVEFAREGLTDIPVPAVNHAMDFIDGKIPSWCYYCCSQRGPYINRLLDTPLAKIRMNGWLFFRFPVGGFLHWGANYWYRRSTRHLVDPFSTQDAGAWPNWPCGDPFILYPGPDGPIDSIRWEVFAESLQDYALLQTAAVNPDGKILAALKDFADFPKSEKWIRQTRRTILKQLESRNSRSRSGSTA